MENHLTDDQRQKAAAFIQKSKGCPSCGSAHLSVEDMVIVPRYWGGVIHGGTDSISMLQVICKDCFYIMHFAAVPAGPNGTGLEEDLPGAYLKSRRPR